MKLTNFLLVLALAVGTGALTRGVETDGLLHDPSTIIKRDNTYWVYGTGRGIQQFSSTDREHWTRRGPVLADTPEWARTAVPANQRNNSWAPDVLLLNGRYHLYLSYSSFGSKVSAIGLATNETLDPLTWTDRGLVVRSGADTDFNAIDPCIFQDADGKPWLCFGSFFRGLRLVEIDPATGKPPAGAKMHEIASRPNVRGNAIEAPCIFYHDGFHYLFVNWDRCCAGSKSTYNIRVGRSKDVTGPYLDKAGISLVQGGGSMFLASVSDRGDGQPFDDRVGPGHVGILQEGDSYRVSTHYEWSRAHRGAATLNVDPLVWDGDGWPRVVLDPGPWKIVSAKGSHDVLSSQKAPAGAAGLLEVSVADGSDRQKWQLQHTGEGYYRILAVGGAQALTAPGNTTDGVVRPTLSAVQNLDRQLWYIEQNENGTHSIFPKQIPRAQALAAGDGAFIVRTAIASSEGQQWSFRTP